MGMQLMLGNSAGIAAPYVSILSPSIYLPLLPPRLLLDSSHFHVTEIASSFMRRTIHLAS